MKALKFIGLAILIALAGITLIAIGLFLFVPQVML